MVLGEAAFACNRADVALFNKTSDTEHIGQLRVDIGQLRVVRYLSGEGDGGVGKLNREKLKCVHIVTDNCTLKIEIYRFKVSFLCPKGYTPFDKK